MQYMLLLTRSDEDWEALSPTEQDYPGIGRWFGQLAASGKLRGGHELQPARSATTVRWQSGKPIVMDGPFIESKESIGGYAVVDVDDLDEAIEIARTWPAPGHKIEIRPIVARE